MCQPKFKTKNSKGIFRAFLNEELLCCFLSIPRASEAADLGMRVLATR